MMLWGFLIFELQCDEVMHKRLQADHWHCDVVGCGELVPLAEREKHKELKHALITCKCGEKLEPGLIEDHTNNFCIYRLVECKYCCIQCPFSEIDSHQSYCGGRTVPCDL